MLPELERSKFDLAVESLRKRFRPVEIEELKGLEGFLFNVLAGQHSRKEFDRLLKGRFF